GFAFSIIGLPGWAIILILWSSILGSYVNIPVYRFPCGAPQMFEGLPVPILHFINEFFNTDLNPYRKDSVLAVNVGGAIIPIIVSLILLAVDNLWVWSLFGVLIIAVLTNHVARIVPGRGISMPLFVAPMAAALYSFFVPALIAAKVAYVTGTLGTLIGADILNIPKLMRRPELNCQILSIGGAGTFDGVFLAGIFAIFLSFLFV
ncbi:MAG: DUF1614 domain-containing protein, partial [Candidatus Ranarchaeia archaeon]